MSNINKDIYLNCGYAIDISSTSKNGKNGKDGKNQSIKINLVIVKKTSTNENLFHIFSCIKILLLSLI